MLHSLHEDPEHTMFLYKRNIKTGNPGREKVKMSQTWWYGWVWRLVSLLTDRGHEERDKNNDQDEKRACEIFRQDRRQPLLLVRLSSSFEDKKSNTLVKTVYPRQREREQDKSHRDQGNPRRLVRGHIKQEVWRKEDKWFSINFKNMIFTSLR